jgi:hypothetical protein
MRGRSRKNALAAYDAANAEAAQVIFDHPERYGGEGSLMRERETKGAGRRTRPYKEEVHSSL